MKYDSKTKKCTCEEQSLSVDEICDACQIDYEEWCDELATEIVEMSVKDKADKSHGS